jgi:hypothetical protein
MIEILTKKELAEYTVRPLGLDQQMQVRMIARLLQLSDINLASEFTETCGIQCNIVSSGRFMFSY